MRVLSTELGLQVTDITVTGTANPMKDCKHRKDEEFSSAFRSVMATFRKLDSCGISQLLYAISRHTAEVPRDRFSSI